jgi:hypothetical protein
MNYTINSYSMKVELYSNDSDVPFLVQPHNPFTGKPWSSTEEMAGWAAKYDNGRRLALGIVEPEVVEEVQEEPAVINSEE